MTENRMSVGITSEVNLAQVKLVRFLHCKNYCFSFNNVVLNHLSLANSLGSRFKSLENLVKKLISCICLSSAQYFHTEGELGKI